jgi:ferredoxin--NADP+ reductase
MTPTSDRPLRVAIIGAGPASFFAADALLKDETPTTIDMFESLPAPYGLVRYGVAPDHLRLRNICKVFARMAGNENFRYWGNVKVGTDVTVEQLKRHFDALIFGCGAARNRDLGIPGEHLPGSHTAVEIVGWYNGHPDYQNPTFDLDADTAVVIGNGNVAMDVARMLANPVSALAETDVPKSVIDRLEQSSLRRVVVLGRRGPVQCSFGLTEVKEVGEIDGCRTFADPSELELDAISAGELEASERPLVARRVELFNDYARNGAGPDRELEFRFLRSPVRFIGEDKVEGVEVMRNRLEGECGNHRVVATGETEVIPCGLVVRCIGYRGTPIPGVPYDEAAGVFPNDDGRLRDVDGMYAVGWIRRGPIGLIGANKADSLAVVKTLMEDLASLPSCPVPDSDALAVELAEAGVRVVNFADWEALDALECENGAALGKPREKFVNVDDMLNALG